MNNFHRQSPFRKAVKLIVLSYCLQSLINIGYAQDPSALTKAQSIAPAPLIDRLHAVDWWFVFKFNGKSFPGCGPNIDRVCPFGGQPRAYKGTYSQQYVYASSNNPTLTKGGGCIGETVADPLGATFEQVYDRDDYFYVIWNDQFYDSPKIQGCTKECGAPWGHSKGMLVWNEAGEGFVLQVSTPSWPASGNHNFPRNNDGNTLGCVIDENVEVSQHFFALKLTKGDLIEVLKALQNASIVTDVENPQIVKNGGPDDARKLVATLGQKSKSSDITRSRLSTGIEIISKPSDLNVPPWQLISATLDGVPLKAATWWTTPEIPPTDASTPISCWKEGLGKPGAVEIANSGHWDNQSFGLTGGGGPDHNHSKIGISTDPARSISIFGDMNQQGTLTSDTGHHCSSSQNGRGGLFYILNDRQLFQGLGSLLNGDLGP